MSKLIELQEVRGLRKRSRRAALTAHDLRMLRTVERKLLWLSSWTIHHANHVRPSVDGLKVGGHQASSASLVAIMTALYFRVLKPRDRVAVKPHASPVFHADWQRAEGPRECCPGHESLPAVYRGMCISRVRMMSASTSDSDSAGSR